MKRSPGLNACIRIENPPGQLVQQVFVGGEQLEPGRHYTTAFVTEQGVAKKYGRNHRPLRAEIRGTFVRYRRNPQ